MSFSFPLLSILAGVAILGFGLFRFFAWLPLFYGVLGFEIGLLLGTWLTSDAGLTAIMLGVICMLILAAATHVLVPYRRLCSAILVERWLLFRSPIFSVWIG